MFRSITPHSPRAINGTWVASLCLKQVRMISNTDDYQWIDSTATPTNRCNDTSDYDSLTVTFLVCEDKEDEEEIVFDEWAQSFKKPILEFHNNQIFTKVKSIKQKKLRPNNKRMRSNSGLFWHVSEN